jgi:flagellar basal-body rod protein FlgC
MTLDFSGGVMRGVSLFLTGLTLVFALNSQAAKNSTAVAAPSPMSNDFSCNDLRKAAVRMAVHSENIANRNTSRSLEGGHYKKVVLKCKELFCETARVDDFRIVHEPGHPDANQAGYVKYPAIDLASEYAAMNAAATEVRLLADKGLCGVKALISGNSALVKYDTDTSYMSDTLTFGADGKVTSWSRLNRDGSSQHVAFGSDGMPAASK